MTTPLNNKKGTTLVELMVCLVLLALFGTAAVTEGVFQSLHSATSLLIIAVDACKNARTIRIHAVAQV